VTNLKRKALWQAIVWTYRSSRFLAVAIVLASVFGGLLAIAEPYVFKLVIDFLAQGTSLSPGLSIGISLIGILALLGATRILQGIFWDINNMIRRVQSLRIERYMTHAMMKRVSSLDVVYFEDPKFYNTLTRAQQNMWRIIEGFWQMTFLVSQVVSILVIVGALFWFDWRIVGLISLGAIPGVLLAIRTSDVLWSAFAQSSPIFRSAHYYRSLLTEQPQAIKEIKAFQLQEHFLARFRKLFLRFLRKQDKAAIKQLSWYAVIAVIEGTLSVTAAWFVVSAFQRGEISIGDVTFFWALLFQFAGHVRWLVRMIGDVNTHATFLTPLVRVLNFKSTLGLADRPHRFPRKLKQGIEFRDVSFHYPRSKTKVLKGVNLQLKPGESIALVGENGSGKTTLIKLLCRLYDTTGGEVLVDGVNIKEYKQNDLYNNLGVIFQDFMKYEAKVEENIRYGDLRKGRKAHHAAVKSGAWKFIKGLDKRYKTQVGRTLKESGIDLSVGQWQKIALARAFYKDAQVLVLDEPTAAVDARAEYNLFQRFKRLTKNRTTVLISHRFSTVRMADRIVVLAKGRITEQGSHRELMRKNGTYAHLFRLQAEGYKED
jgi:ATP-binding cassette, subfamily B, bacterial